MILRRGACGFSLAYWVWALLLVLVDERHIGVAGKKAKLPAGITSAPINTTWTLQNIKLGFQTTILVSIDPAVDQNAGWPQLVLLQTNASAREVVNNGNSWSVVQLDDTCTIGINVNGLSCNSTSQTIITVFTPGTEPGTYKNFFFCLGGAAFGLDDVQCESYSPFFDIDPGTAQPGNDPAQNAPVATADGELPLFPTGLLYITHHSSVLDALNSVNPSTANPAIAPPSAATSSVDESPTTVSTSSSIQTGTPSVTGTSATSSLSSASQGQTTTNYQRYQHLSNAAKAGIALGVLGFTFMILILALVFIQRSKRARNRHVDPLNYNNEIPNTTPSHVLLSHHPHNSSRDLSAEKEIALTNVAPADSPVREHGSDRGLISELRNNPSGGFEVHSSPFADVEHPPAGPIPPAQPLTRGISNVSGIISPRSIRTPSGRGSEAFSSFGNADARYLRSMGMTEEEWEEERRIDLAIAEAEAERERVRARESR